ncbi:MAG: hypothetical protein WAN87_07195 [Thermoplasmata archaeon]
MASHSMYAPDWDEDALPPESRSDPPAPRVSGRPLPDVHGRPDPEERLVPDDFFRRIGGCFPLLFPSWILLVGALLTWSLEPTVGAGGFHLWILFLVLGIVAGVGGIISYFAEEDEPEGPPTAPARKPTSVASVRPSSPPAPRLSSAGPSKARRVDPGAGRSVSANAKSIMGRTPPPPPPPPPPATAVRAAIPLTPLAPEGESDVAVQELDLLKHDLDGLRRSSPAKS